MIKLRSSRIASALLSLAMGATIIFRCNMTCAQEDGVSEVPFGSMGDPRRDPFQEALELARMHLNESSDRSPPKDGVDYEMVAIAKRWRDVISHRGTSSPSESRLDVARFCGFIEGRIHIRVPAWWESRMSSSVVSQSLVRRSDANSRSPRLIGEVREINGTSVLSCVINKETINVRLSELGMTALSLKNGRAYFAITKEHIYVCICSDISPQPYSLYALDRLTNMLRWKGCVITPTMFAVIPEPRELEIIENGEVVAVFGRFVDCHFASFSVVDGSELSRFSTSLIDLQVQGNDKKMR